jgi:hypothetical protein
MSMQNPLFCWTAGEECSPLCFSVRLMLLNSSRIDTANTGLDVYCHIVSLQALQCFVAGFASGNSISCFCGKFCTIWQWCLSVTLFDNSVVVQVLLPG